MARLAACLRYWIADKLNTEIGWKNACYNDFNYFVFEFLFKIRYQFPITYSLYS